MMADEPEDDVLELGEEDLVQQPEQVDDTQPAAQAQDDIEIPTFGDASEEEADDNDLVKKLRAEIRARDIKLKEREESAKPQPEIVVGEKPTLESCEWDEDKFEAQLDAWKERKRQAEDRANQHTEAQNKANEQWKATLTTYAGKRAAFPADVMDEAETAVAATLNPTQQAIIVSVADNPAKLMIALGRNQAKLDALAETTDPLKFAATIAKLETEVRMTKRKPTAEPDTPQRGSASLSQGAADKKLEQLEKDARRSGDRSKLVAYKAELNRKAA
jgi:hypothetical protein